MRELVTLEEVEELLKTSPKVLLKFTATWCGPCKAVAPVIEEMRPNYPNVEMVQVDLDKSQEVAKKYGVKAVPTFFFIKDGEIVDTVVGADVPEVKKALDSLN